VRTDFSASYFATFPAHDAPSAASVVDDFDFSSPGVLDGSWNHSAHLRGTLGTGFNIYVHTEHLGHLPSRLRFNDHDERGYVEALLRDGVISRGSPVFSHKHFFVRQGSKLRLIFDGRRINARCPEPPSFDMLSHHELAALAARYEWAAKFDLANFYWNLRLCPSIRHLFGFRSEIGDFVWNRMPFGFSHSAHESHLLAGEICSHLRSLGIEVVHFMDDFIVFADTEEQCLRDLVRSISFCEQIGVRVKARKTVWPAQQLPILGVAYDLVAKRSSMPPTYFERQSLPGSSHSRPRARSNGHRTQVFSAPPSS